MQNKMRLSVETHVLSEHFGNEKAIKMLKDAGFDAYDFSYYWGNEKTDILGADYKQRAVALRKLADEIGIECNQAHAPFEFAYTDSMDETNESFLRLVRCIESTSILGAKNLIIHSISPRVLPEGVDFYEYNRKYYKSFIPYCEKFGVCVSVENLFYNNEPILSDPEIMREFVKSFESDCFNICIDIGHLSKTGFIPEEVIKKTEPDMLKALHVHDNDCIGDRHWLPYCGELDWEQITKALGEIGYSGDLTLEIIGFLTKQDTKNLPAALKFAEQTGRLLIKKIKDYCKTK